MKKILIPIDFSTHSKYVCKLASRIIKNTDNEIHLLHMIELPSGIIDMTSGSNFSIPESMLYIRKIRDNLFEYKSNFFPENNNIKHSIRFQNPFEGIQSYSEKIGADLIIMGSKGHSKIEEILVGSNTEKIVRTSKAPVLVVKKNEEDFSPKNIVFASSFKDGKDEALKKLLDFTSEFKSNIHFLKVNTPQKFESTQESTKKINNFIKEYDIPKYSINVYNDSSIEKGILSFANEIKADMIALGTHGRSGISHIFNGSITKHLSKSASQPMLTFKV